MSSRSEPETLGRRIREISRAEAHPVVRQAFLADPYIGFAREVMIILGDPASGRGGLARATFQPGVVTGEVPENTPVSVVCRHGRYEITGLRTA